MITLHIEDEMLENLYHEEFGGDEKAFSEYLSKLAAANNIKYEEDLSYLNEILDDPATLEDSGYTLQEAFAMFKKKYSAD